MMTIGYQFQPRACPLIPRQPFPVRGDVNLSSRYSNAPKPSAPASNAARVCCRRRAMPQHHPYVLLFKMADGLQCPFFFWCQRYHAQGVLRNGNQLIQLGNFQLAKQLRRMRAFILRREVRSFEITPQHLRTSPPRWQRRAIRFSAA